MQRCNKAFAIVEDGAVSRIDRRTARAHDILTRPCAARHVAVVVAVVGAPGAAAADARRALTLILKKDILMRRRYQLEYDTMIYAHSPDTHTLLMLRLLYSCHSYGTIIDFHFQKWQNGHSHLPS